MERTLLIGLVFAIGLLQPVQAAMNARFRAEVVHPFQAGIVNMYVGAIVITLILLVGRIGPPPLAAFRAAPWWSLCGGFVGATLVTVMLVAAPKLGATLLVTVFIVGQLSSSMALDQFGWLGLPKRPADLQRLLAIGLLVAGVVLFERGRARLTRGVRRQAGARQSSE